MDSRIGLKDEKGAVIQWPEIDITWAAYSRPATMVSLDATHFVIVPAHYANETMIEALRASLRSDEMWTHTFYFDGPLDDVAPGAESADFTDATEQPPAAPKGRKAKRERPDTE